MRRTLEQETGVCFLPRPFGLPTRTSSTALVTDVKNGDSLVVTRVEIPEGLRLQRIDAPEAANHPGRRRGGSPLARAKLYRVTLLQFPPQSYYSCSPYPQISPSSVSAHK
jgi:hypothetical protein